MSSDNCFNSKGILVFFHGFSPTIIDSQVMLHAREMKERGVELEVWCFTLTSEAYKKSLDRLEMAQQFSGIKVRLFKMIRPIIPFSGIINGWIFYTKLTKLRPSFYFIHARTDFSAYICGYLRLFTKFTLIWDCRGDTEAEFCSQNPTKTILQGVVNWFRRKLIQWRVFFASISCQKAIFVSEELKRVKGNWLTTQIKEVIPCTASSKIFFFSQEIRKVYRKKLGFVDTDEVLIYSGSLSEYQCFSESISMFRGIYNRNKNYKLLILTPYIDEAKEFTSSLPIESFQMFSVRFEEVNAYLNAADFGLMLRRHSPINRVASPVKFAEYCLTGLPVILNESVVQCYKIANELNNLIYYNFTDEPKDLVKRNNSERLQISQKAISLLSREAYINRYLRIYSDEEE